MSYGQSSHSGGHRQGANQSWSQSGWTEADGYQLAGGQNPSGPYAPGNSAFPPAPPGPPAPPAPSGPPAPPGWDGRPAPHHPGWLARSLFWTALILGGLPSLLLAPLSMSGGPQVYALYSIGSILAQSLRLILGVAAILLVKNTSWARRIVGAAIFLIGCVALLVLNPVLSAVINMGEPGSVDSMLVSVIQGVLSACYLAAVLCGWNIARNRRWWILVIAVVIAVLLNVLTAVVGLSLATGLASGVIAVAIIQAVMFGLVFAVLGLCHLLGRVRGGTVQVPSRAAPVYSAPGWQAPSQSGHMPYQP